MFSFEMGNPHEMNQNHRVKILWFTPESGHMNKSNSPEVNSPYVHLQYFKLAAKIILHPYIYIYIYYIYIYIFDTYITVTESIPDFGNLQSRCWALKSSKIRTGFTASELSLVLQPSRQASIPPSKLVSSWIGKSYCKTFVMQTWWFLWSLLLKGQTSQLINNCEKIKDVFY